MSSRGSTLASIPQMKASHMQSNVVCLSLLGPEDEARVRALCPEVIAEIDASIRTAWLPVELDVVLSQAVEDVCEFDQLAEWARQAVYQSARGPLMGPILDGLTRLGLGPRHALRRLPNIWNLIYKNCGSLSCDAEPGHAEIVLSSPPMDTLGESYLRGVGAAFEGGVCALGGRIDENIVDIDADEVRFTLRWTRAAES